MANLALVAGPFFTGPPDGEQERPILQSADSVPNAALNGNQVVGRDYPLITPQP